MATPEEMAGRTYYEDAEAQRTLACIECVILDEQHAIESSIAPLAREQHTHLKELAEREYLEVLFGWDGDRRRESTSTVRRVSEAQNSIDLTPR